MKRLGPFVLFIASCFLTVTAQAGVAEGEAAYLAANYRTALAEIEPAADAGDPHAQYLMGVMHAHGKGVAQDNHIAARWYRKAATAGHTEAAFNLGFMLLNGIGAENEADPEGAAKWLAMAAESGNLTAQYLLGEMHLAGRGVPEDLEAALTWSLRAAHRGHARAQFNAGMIYGQRDPTAENLKEAYKWFRLAGVQNYPGAETNARIIARQMFEEETAEVDAAIADWKPVD